MKKARVIYNQESGRELASKYIGDILIALEQSGYEASTYSVSSWGEGRTEAKRVARLGFELIVSCGGDGTLNEIVNGVSGEEKRPKIAVLPFGTSNDFARALGMSSYMKKNLSILREGYSEAIDVGKVNDEYFVNIAAVGSLTEVSYEASPLLKQNFGQFAYYVKAMEKAPFVKSTGAKFVIDGEEFEEEFMVCFVANSQVVGGIKKLAPLADYQDGLLDVVILKRASVADFARIATKMQFGKHLDDAQIISLQAKEIKIYPKRRCVINIDGEIGGVSPFDSSILPKHIEFIKKR